MPEQKADKGIRAIEKEQTKLARLMADKTGIGSQRRRRGDLK